MIISKTPLRISLIGGGTDLPSYYKNSNFGVVISSSIDKYLYVTLKKQEKLFHEKYRLNYSETEIINDIEEIKNSVIRECIRFMNIDDHLYISTISDVHSQTGLGSSSSLCVGLLNALYKYKGITVNVEKLAEEASHIEINNLNLSLGKQDHYSATYGGLNYYKFFNDERVEINKINIDKKNFNQLKDSILIFWTGIKRSSEPILKEQSQNNKINLKQLDQLRDYTVEFYDLLNNNENISIKFFGELIHKSWMIKRSLAQSITNDFIDKLYNIALKNGAFGGKICGAGGGGFMLIVAHPENHLKIINEFKKQNIKRYNLNFDILGSGSKVFEYL